MLVNDSCPEIYAVGKIRIENSVSAIWVCLLIQNALSNLTASVDNLFIKYNVKTIETF